MNHGKREGGSGKRLLLVGVASLAWSCAPAPMSSIEATRVVEAMLRSSAAAWNREDLETFMADYAPDTATTFVSGGRVQHGFNWIRQNYAPSFAPGAVHDSLRFERLEARPLGADHILAMARYVLFRGDSVTSSGPFTLVLQRVNGQWKIIHDHTSRD